MNNYENNRRQRPTVNDRYRQRPPAGNRNGYRPPMRERLSDEYRNEPENNDSKKRTAISVFFTLLIAAVIMFSVFALFFSSRAPLQSCDNINTGCSRQNDSILETTPVDLTPFVGLTIEPVAIDVMEGYTRRLKASFQKPKDEVHFSTAGLKVVWLSDNPEVATIDSYGTITAHAPGQTRIEARISSDKVESNPAYCTVTVKPDYSLPKYQQHEEPDSTATETEPVSQQMP